MLYDWIISPLVNGFYWGAVSILFFAAFMVGLAEYSGIVALLAKGCSKAMDWTMVRIMYWRLDVARKSVLKNFQTKS